MRFFGVDGRLHCATSNATHSPMPYLENRPLTTNDGLTPGLHNRADAVDLSVMRDVRALNVLSIAPSFTISQ